MGMAERCPTRGLSRVWYSFITDLGPLVQTWALQDHLSARLAAVDRDIDSECTSMPVEDDAPDQQKLQQKHGRPLQLGVDRERRCRMAIVG